ncbi:MAG: T9SS type A sorting domain-containing protein [Candidatus Marinimicrobia bacterium]|nr:T9SS type A sorting domain-containing protein [Candidatus Neomarinimicrobiota bacterium]MCF7850375.1 T9SS type A sorting domain-containing protein [Candidatus Neomarinimicrobiota bacterium]MCF7904977.1 T9SS type A sorting domain-containing protein [Candidatus Neomarinimicrobiota bacterium]
MKRGINPKAFCWAICLFSSVLLLANPALLTIQSDTLACDVGKSIKFTAMYTDTLGVEHDTSATWSVDPDSLGIISNQGNFRGAAPGECIVQADLDTLSAWVTVSVFDSTDEKEDMDNANLVILPSDTLIITGETVQFQAFYPDSGGIGGAVDTTITWSMNGMPVGSIDANGLLTSTANGYAIVTAEAGDMSGTALVVVENAVADSVDINSIVVTRDSPNPAGFSNMRELQEGEIWTMSGLPYPLNILNGSSVYFPQGSLHEDIRFHISLPAFFKVSQDSVSCGTDHAIAGVDFQVIVGDSTYETYTFDESLIVGVIYKHGLVAKLGIEASDLALYYAEAYGDSVAMDTSGLSFRTVDLFRNRVFSAVPHFTSLVVGGGATPLALDEHAVSPQICKLSQNYPNPFNPSTKIQFSMDQTAMMNLKIYDVNGHEVQNLINEIKTPGHYAVEWNGLDHSGEMVSTGIYFAKLQSGEFRETIKLVLLR